MIALTISSSSNGDFSSNATRVSFMLKGGSLSRSTMNCCALIRHTGWDWLGVALALNAVPLVAKSCLGAVVFRVERKRLRWRGKAKI